MGLPVVLFALGLLALGMAGLYASTPNTANGLWVMWAAAGLVTIGRAVTAALARRRR